MWRILHFIAFQVQRLSQAVYILEEGVIEDASASGIADVLKGQSVLQCGYFSASPMKQQLLLQQFHLQKILETPLLIRAKFLSHKMTLMKGHRRRQNSGLTLLANAGHFSCLKETEPNPPRLNGAMKMGALLKSSACSIHVRSMLKEDTQSKSLAIWYCEA
eukprot:Gb_39096 [translate_table: standard]